MTDTLDDNFPDYDRDYVVPMIRGELLALEQYRSVLEEMIRYIVDQDRVRRDAKLLENGATDDRDEVILAQFVHKHVAESVPRMVRGSYLVVLWAVFEAALRDLARQLAHRSNAQLTLDDVRGRDFLATVTKYFEKVLGSALCSTEDLYHDLVQLQAARNAIAHANGRLDATSPSVYRVLKPLLETDDAWTMAEGRDWVEFSGRFLQRMTSSVDATLRPHLESLARQ